MVWKISLGLLFIAPLHVLAADFDKTIQPLLKIHCVKCHNDKRARGRLDLSTPAGVAKGGKDGAAVVPAKLEESLLWKRVEAGEMPPDHPLGDADKAILKKWILAGAPGLPTLVTRAHWAFTKLQAPSIPQVKDARRTRTAVDKFLQADLEAKGLTLSPDADRATLIRRVSYTLTGLPPTPEEIDAFVKDQAADAYERMVERYLASKHYGEHWGRHWLDASGYADTNGYFGKESDRPFAWRYRDYVVRAFNADKPFDRFIREQLAGDELVGFTPGMTLSPEQVDMLVATHFVRNGPDGTDDSAPSPEAKRIDRYAALEASEQVIYTALLGLSIKCAKCHDHKFEPISQREYYQAQAILYPAFNPENWIIPKQRVIKAGGDRLAWEAKQKDLSAKIAKLRDEFRTWVKDHRPRGQELVRDEFDKAAGWQPSPGSPVPRAEKGKLLVAAGTDSWIATKQKIDWIPAEIGASVQVTFDLRADRVTPADPVCQYFGFVISASNFAGSPKGERGNLFFDGRFDGGARIYWLQQGSKRYEMIGGIGKTGWAPGRNFGVRVTNLGAGKIRLEHLVNFQPEGGAFELTDKDLPPGPFAFYRYPGRNYEVANLVIERLPPQKANDKPPAADDYGKKLADFTARLQALESQLSPAPGDDIAWLSDVAATPPRVFLLKRGIYGNLGEAVEPAGLSCLAEPDNPFKVEPPAHKRSTGRRLALANWLLKPATKANSLLARVQTNWLWLNHFDTGLVNTPDNFGLSGAVPSHPALLDYLAAEFVRSGWNVKTMHRLLLHSTAFRQASAPTKKGVEIDAANRLLWRFPMRRLAAEEVRDTMLAVAGALDLTPGGPPIPLEGVDGHGARGEVSEMEKPGKQRRSLYVQRRRNVLPTFLQLFDFPAVAANCTDRASSTVVLQSLAQLNSATVRKRAGTLADRLLLEAGGDVARVRTAFVLCVGRTPSAAEEAAVLAFLQEQRTIYAKGPAPERKAMTDFCQMLFASNPFLYVE